MYVKAGLILHKEGYMVVLGVTGPSGSGKGEISKILLNMGYSVIDADAIYHDLLVPPSKCLDELVREFGRHILTAGGLLNRETLASMVFGDENKAKLETLNSITHKHVIDKIKKIICSMRAMGAPVCVIDAPLLIESGLNNMCDFTLAVLADKEVRLKRIMKRDNIDIERAEKRINSQKNDEFYMENSDFTVLNNSDKAQLGSAINEILLMKGISNAK